MLKRLFRQLHLFLGLLSGLIVFTVATTGAIYCWEEEFRNVMYKDLLQVEAKGEQLPLSELMGNAKKEIPKPGVKNIRIRPGESSTVEIILKNKQAVMMDPYTGKVLGVMDKENDFFGVVLRIHRSLLLDDVGKVITGTSATIFVFMLISGIVLWWPKNKAFLKDRLWIRKKGGARRTYDVHSVLGFYASWIIIFVGLTGMVFAFKWAEASMYWMAGSKKVEKRYHSEYAETKKRMKVDEITERAGSLFTHCDECFLSLPEDSAGVFRMTLRYDDGGFYKKSDQLFFDQYSGELLQANLFETASKGEKLRATNYNIHTGKVFGLTGQLLVFFAALISASLPVTGFVMWWRKWRSR